MKNKFKKHIVSIYSNFDQENTQIDEVEERPNKRQKKSNDYEDFFTVGMYLFIVI